MSDVDDIGGTKERSRERDIQDAMSGADHWGAQSLDDGGVVDQHVRRSDKAGRGVEAAEDVFEVDADSAPENLARSTQKVQAEDDARSRSRRKKIKALSIVGVASFAGLVLVAMSLMEQQAPIGVASQPAPAEVSAGSAAIPASVDPMSVRSQFAPPPAAVDGLAASGIALPPVAALPVSPDQPAAGLPVLPAPAAPSPAPTAQTPAPVPVPALDAARLQAVQDENERLRAQLAQMQAAKAAPAAAPAAPRPAAPPRLTFGSDVYRIYKDGVILLDDQGRHVVVGIGGSMRRYGRLISTDPDARTFTTNRGVIRPRG